MTFKLHSRQMAVPHALRMIEAHCARYGVPYDPELYALYEDRFAMAEEEDLEILVLIHGALQDMRRYDISGRTDTAARDMRRELLVRLRFCVKHDVKAWAPHGL